MKNAILTRISTENTALPEFLFVFFETFVVNLDFDPC